MSHIVFFFQAEDGIRDLVRSRGLGDVYKRQLMADLDVLPYTADGQARDAHPNHADEAVVDELHPVSYTHLTLPTSDLV